MSEKSYFYAMLKKSCIKSGEMKKSHLKMTVNRKIHVRISKKNFWYVFGPCANRLCKKILGEKNSYSCFIDRY